MATSDGSGAELHVFMPDSFGRYRYLQNGTLTDSVLLDSKAYFGHPDLYYFNARWYDYERGRWMSREPLGIDGPNLYHFTFNDPVNGYDPNGLMTVVITNLPIDDPSIPVGDVNIYSNDWRRHLERIAPHLEEGDTVRIFGHGSAGCAPCDISVEVIELQEGPLIANLRGVTIFFDSCDFASDALYDFGTKTGPIFSEYLGGAKISGPKGPVRNYPGTDFPFSYSGFEIYDPYPTPPGPSKPNCVLGCS